MSKSAKKPLTAMISIRVSEKEMALLQDRATRAGMTVSAYVRNTIERHINPQTATFQWPPSSPVTTNTATTTYA